jgi:hypothetical protein
MVYRRKMDRRRKQSQDSTRGSEMVDYDRISPHRKPLPEFDYLEQRTYRVFNLPLIHKVYERRNDQAPGRDNKGPIAQCFDKLILREKYHVKFFRVYLL